jgi:hypothetical protein
MVILALLLSSAAFAQTPWETYLELPSSDNAARVLKTSYTDQASRVDHLFEDLLLLEIQVISMDLEAVRLAFRLLTESDGHYGEMLDIMLGRLIRIDPELFLRELKDSGNKITRLDALVGNTGFPYVDRSRAREYETEKRIEALMTVIDPHLKVIRDKCVSELKK